MDEHLIFFIDFLGFAEAARTWDHDKKAILIKLLHDLASLRSEFDLGEKPMAEGRGQFNVKPAVTTFSDHIVISYPTEEMQKLSGQDPFGITLLLAQQLIGALAAAATNLGLLIRGGLTVGPLYHSGGVVIGEAMNEAYRLESRVSIYPRIAVSRKVYSKIKTIPRETLVREDYDGIAYFNYFISMILAGGGQPGNDFRQQLNRWLIQTRRIVTENVEQLEESERWNELAKWVWFRNRLEEARNGMNNAIFE